MEKIPNIVRQRFAAQQPPGEHPGTDLLTAFAEQRLIGVERDNVLAHLSRCSLCREIAVIASNAAPEIAVDSVPATATGARPWWAVAAFQWGAAAAAVAMIAVGLIILQPGEKREQLASNSEYSATSAQPSSSAAARSDQAALPPRQNNAEVKEPSGAPDRRARALRPGEAPSFTDKAKQAPSTRGAESSVGVDTAADSATLAKDVNEKADTLQKREARVKPQATGALISDAKSQNAQVSNPPSAARVGRGEVVGGIVTHTEPGVGTNTSQTPVITAADQASVSVSTPQTAPAPQELPSSRTAQTSRQNLALSASHAADELAVGKAGTAVEVQRNRRALSVKPPPGTWRITNGRLQHFDASSAAWNDIDVGSAASLSIVATLGPEVWVGGTDGAMFYSNDQGAHWIPTSTGGWSSDATITGMTPTARRSVEVYFSNGERWRSGDGGASWTRYQ